MDLFLDYVSNVVLYLVLYVYFCVYCLLLFVVWGCNDIIFILFGVEVFKCDLLDVEIYFVDSGYFVLEMYYVEIGVCMFDFFGCVMK